MQNEAIANSTSNLTSACGESNSEMLELVEIVDTSTTNSDSSATSSNVSSTHKSSTLLLQETIEKLFEDEQLSNINIENLITFWLTLSTPPENEPAALGSSSFNAAIASTQSAQQSSSILHLSESTANHLLDYLHDYAFMTVKLWHLSFRMLTQLLSTSERLDIARAFALNKAEAVYKFVYKFLSAATSMDELVGDECCQSLVEFLRRLGECVAAVSFECERTFKMKLFHILCTSIENDGCVNRSQGPIDAQVTFIEFLIGILDHHLIKYN